MDDKSIAIDEFEHQIRSTIEMFNKPLEGDIKDHEDISTVMFERMDVVISMAMRAYVAVSVGLASSNFMAHVMQLIKKLHIKFSLPSSYGRIDKYKIDAQEAHKILRRYISLEEEYISNMQRFVKNYPMVSVEDNFGSIFNNIDPESFINFMLFAKDVDSYITELTETRIERGLLDKVRERFRRVIEAFHDICGILELRDIALENYTNVEAIVPETGKKISEDGGSGWVEF